MREGWEQPYLPACEWWVKFRDNSSGNPIMCKVMAISKIFTSSAGVAHPKHLRDQTIRVNGYGRPHSDLESAMLEAEELASEIEEWFGWNKPKVVQATLPAFPGQKPAWLSKKLGGKL